MLILTRRVTETLIIGNEIAVTILGTRGKHVRIGVDAPKDTSIHRKEIWLKIQKEKIDEPQA